jgi:hypothetical protein
MSGKRKKKEGDRVLKRKGLADQPPTLVSNRWITASCLAMTWACQISAITKRLMEKMQTATVRPI